MKPFINFTLLLIIIIGCEGVPGPVGPPGTNGPSLTGNIEGYAILYHEDDYSYSNSSGITVSLEGTAFSTTTDSTGWWRLQNVPTGTYNILYNKNGFFSHKMYGVQFVGGGTIYLYQTYYSPQIYELPAFTIKTIKYVRDFSYLTISGEITSSSRLGRYIFVLFDSVRSISKEKFIGWSNIYVQGDSTKFSRTYANMYLPFKSGQWMYIRCYPGVWASNIEMDPITRKMITYNVGDPSTALDSIYVP